MPRKIEHICSVMVLLLASAVFLLSPNVSLAASASSSTNVGVSVVTTGPITIFNVSTINITTNAADVTFNTDFPSTCTVRWGTDLTYSGGSRVEVGERTSHAVSLVGLTADTHYFYRIDCVRGSQTGNASGFSFTTLPNPTTELVISNVSTLNVDTNSADVTFITNDPAACTIEWDTDTNFDNGSQTNNALQVNHSFSLTGLRQGDHYYYRLSCHDSTRTATAGTFTFNTDFEIPDFTVDVLGSGNNSKARFRGTTERNWTVHLVVTGPGDFTRDIDAGNNGSWQYMTAFLPAGVYYAKLYVVNEHGEHSDYSNTQSFIIVGGKVPTQETITPTGEPTEPTPPGTEPPTLPPGRPVETEKPTEPNIPGREPAETNPFKSLTTSLLDVFNVNPELSQAINETVQEVSQMVEANKGKIAVGTVSSAVAASLPFLLELNSLKDLLLLLRGAFGVLIGIFIDRRKREWGIVYNTESGKPVPMAVVNIFNESGKKSDSRITDGMGTYGFLVPSGKYTMDVEKKGYEFRILKSYPIFYHNIYEGQVMDLDEEDLIKKDIPVVPIEGGKEPLMRNRHILQGILFLLFWGGFAFSLFALSVSPILINYVICGLYVLSGILRHFVGDSRHWGTVFGPDGNRKPFVYIKAYDKKTNTMVARTISDEHGRYYMILDTGSYVMEAQSNTGEMWRGALTIKDRSAIKQKIVLKRQARSRFVAK